MAESPFDFFDPPREQISQHIGLFPDRRPFGRLPEILRVFPDPQNDRGWPSVVIPKACAIPICHPEGVQRLKDLGEGMAMPDPGSRRRAAVPMHPNQPTKEEIFSWLTKIMTPRSITPTACAA